MNLQPLPPHSNTLPLHHQVSTSRFFAKTNRILSVATLFGDMWRPSLDQEENRDSTKKQSFLKNDFHLFLLKFKHFWKKNDETLNCKTLRVQRQQIMLLHWPVYLLLTKKHLFLISYFSKEKSIFLTNQNYSGEEKIIFFTTQKTRSF